MMLKANSIRELPNKRNLHVHYDYVRHISHYHQQLRYKTTENFNFRGLPANFTVGTVNRSFLLLTLIEPRVGM